MAKRITQKQIKKIWTKADELGMTEGQLRDLVKWVSGQESTRELTKRQGIRLIDVLEGKISNPPPYPLQRGTSSPVSNQSGIILSPRKFPKKDKKVIGRFVPLATPDQLSLIENLKKEAGWDDEHLLNFVRKIFKRDTLDKLSCNEAGVVITVLKRAKKKQVTEV